MPLIFLAVIAVVPFLGILHGQYLYDDVQVIVLNRALANVTHFVDCFTFVLKPSKPVTNFLIALGQWLGGGDIAAHRAISLAVHLGSTWLLYFNVRKWGSAGLPAFGIAALFAIAPVHTEGMGVILFRMDAVGTFFTLAALLAMAFDQWLVVFLAVGAAALSKETFAVITPLTLLAFRRDVRIVGIAMAWGGMLLKLLQTDAASDYPYADVIGRGIQSVPEQIRLAAVAAAEAARKLVTGRDLSILPPRVRGAGVDWFWLTIAAMGIVAALRGNRRWGVSMLVGLGVYLAIPNLNIGSEHYLSFVAVGFATTVVPFLHARLGAPALVVVFLAWAIATEARLAHFGTRLDLHRAELRGHPEAAVAWSNVAAALLEDPTRVVEAKPYLDHARRLAPNDPNVLVVDLLYRIRAEELDAAERTLGTIERHYPGKPRTIAAFEYEVGRLAEKRGECARAEAAFGRARTLDAKNETYRRNCERGRG